jgi:hypothetical protein
MLMSMLPPDHSLETAAPGQLASAHFPATMARNWVLALSQGERVVFPSLAPGVQPEIWVKTSSPRRNEQFLLNVIQDVVRIHPTGPLQQVA